MFTNIAPDTLTFWSERVSPSICKLPVDRDTQKENLQAGDVGLIPRQFLTRAEGFFGDRFSLTLCDKLIRGHVPK